jgi:hypothetical protein
MNLGRWGQGCLAILLGLFTYFQWNDPDPLVWMVYYGIAAVGAAMAATGRSVNAWASFCGGASVVLLLQAAPGVQAYWTNADGNGLLQAMNRDYPYIEQTREFGGILVVLVWAITARAGFHVRPKGDLAHD